VTLDPNLGASPSVGRAVFHERVAVIGDIHGELERLDRLLAMLPRGIPLIVVGDVIDRGPDARGVVERLVERGAIGVRGNHEEWLLRLVSTGSLDRAALGPALSGSATLRSYGFASSSPEEIEAQVDQVPQAHRAWLRALPVALDLDVHSQRYWVIHAGVPSTVELRGLRIEEVVPFLAAHHPATLTWPSNDPEWMIPLDRPIIMGHMVQKRPRDLGNVVAIDTGCGRPGGRLSAVLLPERRFVTEGR